MAGGGFGSDPVSSGLLCGDWVRVGEGASPMVPTCQLSHHNKISFQRNIFGFSRGKEREERPKVHPRVLVMIPPLALWHDTRRCIMVRRPRRLLGLFYRIYTSLFLLFILLKDNLLFSL